MLDADMIASWYAMYHEDKVKIHLLTLFALACFKANDIEVKYEQLSFSIRNFNFGISKYDQSFLLTEKETHILKFIQHEYGYIKTKDLLYKLATIENPTIENICSSLKFEIMNEYEGYQYYDFNEYVLVIKDVIFYIKAGTYLSDDEKEELNNHNQQERYYVFRDEISGKLVVF